MSEEESFSEDEFQDPKKLKHHQPSKDPVASHTHEDENKKISSSCSSKISKCKFCCKVFAQARNVSRHERHCVANPRQSSKKFQCDICFKTFPRLDHLKNHQKKPCLVENANIHQARSKCMIPDCEEVFFHKSSLLEHIKHKHGSAFTEPVHIDFPSLNDFIMWKDNEEEKNYSYFSMQSGESNKKRQVIYLYCQHDGSAKLRDDFATRKRERVFGVAGTSTEAIYMRHKKALDISNDSIEIYLSGTAYFFRSASDPDNIKYHIVKHFSSCFKKNCKDNCKEEECKGLCAHLYSCSCPDKSPLCKHIHKLHMYLLESGSISPAACAENEEDGDQGVHFFCNTEPTSEFIGERFKENRLKRFD